jgi:hypothetical protein
LKTFFSAVFGFGFSLFVEGFSRIIISFFHQQDFYFFGIDALPSPSWIIIIYVVSAVSTWLGVMLTLSISDPNSKNGYLIVSSLIIVWIIFETLSSIKMVPVWYLSTFPFTSLIGLVVAKLSYKPLATANAPTFN